MHRNWIVAFQLDGALNKRIWNGEEPIPILNPFYDLTMLIQMVHLKLCDAERDSYCSAPALARSFQEVMGFVPEWGRDGSSIGVNSSGLPEFG